MIDYDREKGRRLHDSILAAIENNAPVMMYGGEAFLYARDLIAELEAEIAKRERPDLKVLYAAIAERDKCIAELETEAMIIGRYMASDPPFDVCAGIDLHERAADYDNKQNCEINADPDAYFRAFVDCCKAALKQEASKDE